MNLLENVAVSKVVVRDSAIGLTTRKRLELLELAQRWQTARATYIDELWPVNQVERLLTAPRAIVEDRRQAGWGTRLGAHQSELALKSAISCMRGSWGRTLAAARGPVTSDRSLSEPDKHWMRYVLRSPDLVCRVLVGTAPHVEFNWAEGLDEGRLARRLRRTLLRVRGGKPRPPRKPWFEVDTNGYRVVDRTLAHGPFSADRHFRGAWLALTGLQRGRRILVPLAGASLEDFAPRTSLRNSKPGLRVEVGERIEFRLRKTITVEKRIGTEIGIDKGLLALLTVSSGDPAESVQWGRDADLVRRVAEESRVRRRMRHRIEAHERSLRPADPTQARRIRRNNLGRRRLMERLRRDRVLLRERVNGTLNEFFRASPTVGKMHVEALPGRSKRLSRSMNTVLGRWLKGFLHRRLQYKAELNGVELNVVNAAYTSQTCPRCGFVSASNRRGERFQCGDCSYTGSADAVAATNVLRRGSDSAITRFMRTGLVKQILEERWRSARNGRAWGSNEGTTLAEDEGIAVSERAANNRTVPQCSARSIPQHPLERTRRITRPLLRDDEVRGGTSGVADGTPV